MTIINITKEDYEGSYLKTYQNDIVIVLFKAEWCKFCVQFKPLYEELAKKYKSNIVFTQIDIDKENELLNNINADPFSYSIKTYPTIVIYKQGYYLTTYSKKREKDLLVKFLNDLI